MRKMKIKLIEEVENWDSARVIDIVRYCVNKGCDVDKTFKVVYNQMKEEGSTLPKDLSVLRKAVLDAYDDVDFDESLNEDLSSITLKGGRTYPIKDKDFLKGKTAGYSNENGLEHIFNIKTKNGKRYAIYDSGFGNMSHADKCAVLLDESILDKQGYKKCPYCHNHTLVEIDFGDYICDECGEEFSGYEDYYGNIILEKEIDESLSEELKEDKMQELVEKAVRGTYTIYIYLNEAGRERREIDSTDLKDFIVEYPQSEEEFFEIITDELELADWEDINTEKDLTTFLENQDYSFGDPIIYKAIWKGRTIYDDSDYFEALKKGFQDSLSKTYREDLDEDWRDAYEKFNAIVDKHFTFDDVDPDAIEAEVEELYRFHEGEPEWEEAYRRWTSEVKESDLSEEAVKNPNFDREKYGRFFDENDHLIPELAKEYFDLVHQEQKAQYDFSNKEKETDNI